MCIYFFQGRTRVDHFQHLCFTCFCFFYPAMCCFYFYCLYSLLFSIPLNLYCAAQGTENEAQTQISCVCVNELFHLQLIKLQIRLSYLLDTG